MNTDASLIVQIQIALIGVILITGLFFVWRALCRIEDKVNNILSNSTIYSENSECHLNLSDPNRAAEALMKEVFGSDEPIVMFTDTNIPQQTSGSSINATIVEEINEHEKENESEIDGESTIGLSKTKLNKMTHEKLVDLCKEKDLATDGTKKVLIERLLSA